MKNWQKLKNQPTFWETFFLREKAYQAIRTFFSLQNFHEVETPLLVSHPPAESYVDVFATTLYDRNRKATPAYLTTSPEMNLKKLLVAGIGNCYSIAKSFRNMEQGSTIHNPEFTLLEWYRVGATYTDSIEDCEALVLSIKQSVLAQKPLVYQGNTIQLARPWERISVIDAFATWPGITADTLFDFDSLRQVAAHKGYRVEVDTTWEQLYNQIFLNEVEPRLPKDKPVFLYDFPAAMAALAKTKESDQRVCERFELYMGGLELADCYGELTDPLEQKKRFDRELAEVHRLGKTTYDYDKDFLEALAVGLPACSGVALGIDRLLMLFADTTDIGDVLFFPASQEFV